MAFKLRDLELRTADVPYRERVVLERAFNIVGHPELRACYDALLGDRDLPQQLVEFVGAHLQLQSTLASAKADMEAAAKAAREESRKKTPKPSRATTTAAPLAPDPPATSKHETAPSLFAPPDQPQPAVNEGASTVSD
jgi:hypothetical protein